MTAETVRLPSGASIRAVRPDYLVATKLEAYFGRGNGDMLSSVDFEDLVRLVDGREELGAEIEHAPPELRSYVVESLGSLSGQPLFETAVGGALYPDAASQARLPLVLQRIAQIRDA